MDILEVDGKRLIKLDDAAKLLGKAESTILQMMRPKKNKATGKTRLAQITPHKVLGRGVWVNLNELTPTEKKKQPVPKQFVKAKAEAEPKGKK